MITTGKLLKSDNIYREEAEMKKKMVIIVSLLFLTLAVALGGVKLYRLYRARQCGILLAFDDYNADTWEEHFDLFDRYNVKVTFFVNAYEPTEFCFNAIEHGHEIAHHTAAHVNLTDITEDEIYQQAIAPIEAFREQGIELTTFAYPYGAYNEKLNELLLQHYNILRGAYYYQLAGKDQMRNGFVESLSIDNVNYESEEEFRDRIDFVLEELNNNEGAVVGLYSHAIADGGAWCVSEERLEYIFKRAKEMGIQFYTYKELQKD